MRYRLAIFDFDGTLADSFPFFIASFNHLADRHAFHRLRPEEIDALRGCSARELMTRVGMPAWKLPRVARSFMALMQENQERIPLFEGVADTLDYLAAQQLVLAVVSSNSHRNVTGVLGPHCRHISHFECGASIFGKASRLRRVLRKAGVAAAEAIYIGDQPMDHEAAKAAGMDFGAVSWGYGSAAAFHGLRPDVEFRTVAEIKMIAGGSARDGGRP